MEQPRHGSESSAFPDIFPVPVSPRQMPKTTLVFWLCFLGAALSPALAAQACLMVFTVQVIVILLRLAARLLPAEPWADHPQTITPIFSIHLAIRNEPPRLVIDTLKALAQQDFPSALWEVVVIDNNTTEPTLWRPVMDFCAQQGPRFNFLHREGVKGAKAGALNIAFAHSRADATHIVTIDADYLVEADFLSEAARALRETGADYVQFPQAYRRRGRVAQGTDVELQEYFLSDARAADDAEAVLLTGTLCVISKTSLVRAGGWSGCTATEDAELGVRLCKAGFRGRYIPKIVGKGLLPLTLQDLEKQRYRWGSGNLRTLLCHGRGLLQGNEALRGRQVLAITAQLCAWLNFTLIPTACLLSTALTQKGTSAVLNIAALSLLLSLSETLTRFFSRQHRESYGARVALSAVASRLALAPVSARATVAACLPGAQGFTVTRKGVVVRREPADLPHDHLVIFVLALLSLWTLAEGPLVPSLGTAVLLLPLPAGLWLSSELSRYRHSIQPGQSSEVIA